MTISSPEELKDLREKAEKRFADLQLICFSCQAPWALNVDKERCPTAHEEHWGHEWVQPRVLDLTERLVSANTTAGEWQNVAKDFLGRRADYMTPAQARTAVTELGLEAAKERYVSAGVLMELAQAFLAKAKEWERAGSASYAAQLRRPANLLYALVDGVACVYDPVPPDVEAPNDVLRRALEANQDSMRLALGTLSTILARFQRRCATGMSGPLDKGECLNEGHGSTEHQHLRALRTEMDRMQKAHDAALTILSDLTRNEGSSNPADAASERTGETVADREHRLVSPEDAAARPSDLFEDQKRAWLEGIKQQAERALEMMSAAPEGTFGECVGHLGPPGNTATPHMRKETCSHWKPLPSKKMTEGELLRDVLLAGPRLPPKEEAKNFLVAAALHCAKTGEKRLTASLLGLSRALARAYATIIEKK